MSSRNTAKKLAHHHRSAPKPAAKVARKLLKKPKARLAKVTKFPASKVRKPLAPARKAPQPLVYNKPR